MTKIVAVPISFLVVLLPNLSTTNSLITPHGSNQHNQLYTQHHYNGNTILRTCPMPYKETRYHLTGIGNRRFTNVYSRNQRSGKVSLFGGNFDNEDDDIHNEDHLEIEAVRRELEGRFTQDETKENSPRRSSRYPPLTTTLLEIQSPPQPTDVERKHLAREIELLSSLYQSENEEVITELWNHWFTERGHAAASELLHAEQLANLEDGHELYNQDEAERIFRELIDEHGIYWAEPVNRLATLLFRQGRYEESKACCELVLAVKPWHFGALSGIVMVCSQMRDIVNAKIWADRRLAPLQYGGSNNIRRKNWIKRAVTDATTMLFRPHVECYQKEEDIVIDGIYSDDFENSWQ